jgi:hypothetical protein
LVCRFHELRRKRRLRSNDCRRCRHSTLNRWRSVTRGSVSAHDKLHIARFDNQLIARTAIDNLQYLGDFLVS